MAGLFLAGTVAAHAQGTATAQAPPATVEAGSGTRPASDSGAGAQAQTGTQPQTPQSTASQAATSHPDPGAKTGKPHSFCFKLTGHCVAGTKAAATEPASNAGSSATKDTSGAQKSLNLTAPDVRTVIPAEELKEPLPSGQQVAEATEADTVSVKGDKGVPPDVPGGFGALWWALNHPSQAWRILTPAE
jgi:hypothetical protein